MRRSVLVLSLAVACVSAPLVAAQAASGSASTPAKRPMTVEDLMAMKRLGMTAVSPDGKWLAYEVTTVNLEQNTKTAELWVQAISGGEPQKIVVAQVGDSGIQFAPDGHSVLFLSGREGGQQIWTAEFDDATGATSNAKKLTAISTEAGNAIWSPDGKSIVFTSAVYQDCPAIGVNDGGVGNKCNADRDAAAASSKVKAQIFTHLLYRHWDHFTGDKRTHLFLLMVATGAVRDLTPNDPHDLPPDYPSVEQGCGCAFAPDGKELAFTENLDAEPAISTHADIFTLDLTNPAAKPVKISTSLGGNFNPAYSPDGKYIAWRSQERAGYESDKFHLVLYDRTVKTIRGLLPEMDHWIDEFIWSPDSKRLYFTSGDHGGEPIYSVGVNANRFFILAVGGGQFSGLSISADGRTLIASGMHLSQPPEAYILFFPPEDQSSKAALANIDKLTPEERLALFAKLKTTTYTGEHQLTHLNDDLLAQLDFGDAEDFEFDAKDKTELQGFIIRPPGFDPAKRYPVKLLIHGGPQGAWGDSWSYRWNAELFAANGYVVVMINPRGSTGYGQKFTDEINGDWGGKPFTDLMTGLDYAEQHFSFIDKTRECALGASYGGYMANWILGHTDRFKCIVSHDGMFNPESAWGTTDELWFNEWEFKGKPWDYYGKPDAENLYRKWSAMMSAKNFKTPTLVIHNQLDYRLDLSEGFQLFTTLQRLKVPSKMLYFPDEGHWVLKPQNSRLWYKTVNDWVDEWTRKTGTRE